MERVSRRPFGPAAQSSTAACAIPATAPRAGLKSPAWATGQGCSPAVAPAAPGLRAGRGLRKETKRTARTRVVRNPWNGEYPMKLIRSIPRALNDNPDPTRRTKVLATERTPLLLATIRVVGIIQPPIVTAQRGRCNGFIIEIAPSPCSRRPSPRAR